MKRLLILGAFGLAALSGCATDSTSDTSSSLQTARALVAGESVASADSTLVGKLSDADLSALESILADLQAGTISTEEAVGQVQDLIDAATSDGGILGGLLGFGHGFEMRGGHGHGEEFGIVFGDLTDEQRAAIEDIRARVESGEITRAEARAEIEALGITLPTPPWFEGLTEEQQAAVQAIFDRVDAGEITREEARKEIEALGITLPTPPGFENLTDEQRAALEDIHARVESGEITREEARAEIEALGITLPERGGFGHGGPSGRRGMGGFLGGL